MVDVPMGFGEVYHFSLQIYCFFFIRANILTIFAKINVFFCFFAGKLLLLQSKMSLLSLIKSSNMRNFSKLLTSNVVAQVIGLLVYPILTRIYAPEDFGLLNLFLSIGGVLVIISVAEYYYAIVLPKEDKDADAVLGVGFVCLIMVSVLIAISSLFSDYIAAIFKTPSLASYYWLMPFYVFALGAWNLLNYWYIRQKEYNPISRYQISQNVFSSGGKLAFGYGGILHGGMIYSVVIAPMLSLLTSVLGCRKKLQKIVREVSWNDIKKQAVVYRNFPCFVLPRSFVNILAGQMPVLLLTPFFGAKVVGFLSLAILLGYTPIGTITRAIYQVMYQHTMDRVHSLQPIGGIFKRFLLLASIVVIPAFAILWFFLPDLTSWLLGSEWWISGEYIRWMLPWLYVSLLSCSINFLFDVFMKQQWGLFFEIVLAVMRVGGLLIGIMANDFTLAIICYSFGTMLALVMQIVWMLVQVHRYDCSLDNAKD
jgi:O-antigen/teichoic acid export membrane protein